MSYEFYKICHFLGLFLLIPGIFALIWVKGLIRTGQIVPASLQKFAGAAHGLGLVLVLVAGFGLMAKLHLGFPIWVGAKLAIWLSIGLSPLAARWLNSRLVLLTVLVLATIAAGLAVYKPGLSEARQPDAPLDAQTTDSGS